MFEAAYQRGLILYRQNRYDMAADEFRHALSMQPGHAGAQSMFALCQMMLNKHAEAETAGRTALESNPNNAFSHYAYAHILKRKATRQYTGKFFPSVPRRTQTIRQLLEPALFHASESLRLAPGNPDYLLVLAEIESNCERLDTALMALDQGLAQDPQHIGCANFRSYVLRRLGRLAEAKDTGTRALQIDPERSETHLSHGLTLLQSQAPTAAIEHFREALRLDPTDQQARTNLVSAAKARCVVHHRLSGKANVVFIIAGVIFLLAAMVQGLSPDSDPKSSDRYSILAWGGVYVLAAAFTSQALTLRLRGSSDFANALPEKQRIGNNILCAGAMVGFIEGLALDFGGEPAGVSVLLLLSAAFPLAIALGKESYGQRRRWRWVAALMALVGAITTAFYLLGSGEDARSAAQVGALLYLSIDILLLRLYYAKN